LTRSPHAVEHDFDFAPAAGRNRGARPVYFHTITGADDFDFEVLLADVVKLIDGRYLVAFIGAFKSEYFKIKFYYRVSRVRRCIRRRDGISLVFKNLI